MGELLRIRYRRQDVCPLCGSDGQEVGSLGGDHYEFGTLRIAYPPEGSPVLARCPACALVFKQSVPQPDDLSRVFEQAAASVWQSHGYRYPNERRAILAALPPGRSIDVLDVGSSDGGMLRAFDGLGGRRSGLDVVPNPRCQEAIRGEYILGMLDGPLAWSGQPYDAVLAFDVLEHVYDARAALEHLAAFVRPGGVLLAQTGDAASVGGDSNALRKWRYLRLLEHHVAWSAQSLMRAARDAGFDVERMDRTQNKEFSYMPSWKRGALHAIKTATRFPGGTPLARLALGRDPELLADPRALDHVTTLLRKR